MRAMLHERAAGHEKAYEAIITAAYAHDPDGWDQDDLLSRAERLKAFLRTSKGRHLLDRLEKLGLKLRF
jgi:hypothetical protein